MASALAKHGGDLSSYILQLDHRVEQMMIGIKNNHMVTKLINAKLNDESRAIQDRFSTMLSLFAQQLDQSYTVNHHLDKISAAIADLVTGKLSPLIIPPGDITTTLDFVQNHLSVQGFHVVRQSPQYYYKYGSFTVTRRSHSVFISLKFPITFHKEPFKLYKILSFPVPINDTSRDATQIVDINDYFLISADERYHVSLPRSTINQCVGISLMTCPIRPLLKTMKEPDCEAVLFQN